MNKANFSKDTFKKGTNRLKESFELIIDWLHGEKEIAEWKLIPALFFDKKSSDTVTPCSNTSSNCQARQNIIDTSNMRIQLDTMFNAISNTSQTDQKAWETDDLRHIACCLLFLMHDDPIKTPTIISKVLKLLENYSG